MRRSAQYSAPDTTMPLPRFGAASGSNSPLAVIFFFLNNTATTEFYTLSLHDALPISCVRTTATRDAETLTRIATRLGRLPNAGDRKSTRLHSSHVELSYAVLCLK